MSQINDINTEVGQKENDDTIFNFVTEKKVHKQQDKDNLIYFQLRPKFNKASN